MLRSVFAALVRRRPARDAGAAAERPRLTRQDVQTLLREELDRMAPLSC